MEGKQAQPPKSPAFILKEVVGRARSLNKTRDARHLPVPGCIRRDLEAVLQEDRQKLKLLQGLQPRFTDAQKQELQEVHPWVRAGGLPAAVDVAVSALLPTACGRALCRERARLRGSDFQNAVCCPKRGTATRFRLLRRTFFRWLRSIAPSRVFSMPELPRVLRLETSPVFHCFLPPPRPPGARHPLPQTRGSLGLPHVCLPHTTVVVIVAA